MLRHPVVVESVVIFVSCAAGEDGRKFPVLSTGAWSWCVELVDADVINSHILDLSHPYIAEFKDQMQRFYSAVALHAMQSAVIPTAIPSVRLSVRPSVRPSVRHTLVPYPDE